MSSIQNRLIDVLEFLLFKIVLPLTLLPFRLYYFFFNPYFLDWYHLVISREGIKLLTHEEFMVEKRRELIEIWETAPVEKRIEEIIYQSKGVNYLVFSIEGFREIYVWKAQRKHSVEWFLDGEDRYDPQTLAMLGLLNIMGIHAEEHIVRDWLTPVPASFECVEGSESGLYRVRFRNHKDQLSQFIHRLTTDVYKFPLEDVRFRVG